MGQTAPSINTLINNGKKRKHCNMCHSCCHFLCISCGHYYSSEIKFQSLEQHIAHKPNQTNYFEYLSVSKFFFVNTKDAN